MGKVFLKDISLALAKKKALDTAEAEAYLDAFFSVIEEGLCADNVVKIRGLGTFKLVEVRDRESVDVNTGERVVIDGHAKVTFTPENSLKELVNKPFSQFETVELNDGVDFDKETNDIDLTASDTNDSSFVLSSGDGGAGINTEDETGNESIVIEEASTDSSSETPSQEQNTESASVTAAEPSILQPQEDTDREDAEGDSDRISIDTEIVSQVETTADEDSANGETTAKEADEHIAEVVEEETVENGNQSLNEGTVPLAPADIPATDSTSPEAVRKKSKALQRVVYALMFLAVVVGMFFAGFYFGEKRDIAPVAETPKVSSPAKPLPEKPVAASKPASSHVDTAKADATEQPEVGKKDNDKTQDIKEDTHGKGRDEAILPDPSLAIAQTMVRTGAYNIVGTDKSVIVKPGQTMKSLARRYLGEGMECYIQVHNKQNEVKAGETINIPKLQLKKKGRNKKVS